jgi:hypothetical protein
LGCRGPKTNIGVLVGAETGIRLPVGGGWGGQWGGNVARVCVCVCKRGDGSRESSGGRRLEAAREGESEEKRTMASAVSSERWVRRDTMSGGGGLLVQVLESQ